MSEENILAVKRNIDVVFCIDGTGSMSPCIESVKSNARRFRLEFVKAISKMGSEIDSMRVKIIVFRDYECDGNSAMQISPFFELPTDEADFDKYMAGISASGGGDAPENGLEALYYAMKSDFATGMKDRQVIALFTDADALPLGKRKGCGEYPSDMVDRDGLIEMWGCVKQDKDFKLRDICKRLVMFAPAGTEYEKLKPLLTRSVFEPVSMSSGLGEIDFKEIIDIIAASASSAM